MKNFNRDFNKVMNLDFERIKRELNMYQKDSNNKKIVNEFNRGVYAMRNNNLVLNNKLVSFNSDIRELKDLYYEMKNKLEIPFFGYRDISHVQNYDPSVDNGLLKYINESNLNNANKNTTNDIIDKVTKLQNENLELLKHLNSIQNSVDFNKNQLISANINGGINKMMKNFSNLNTINNNTANISQNKQQHDLKKNMILKTLSDISNKFKVQQSKLEYYQKAFDDFERNENS